jgi:Holliday junction resolvase RusA-like endonuclease
MKVSFTVPGEPIAKARPRVFFNKKAGRAMAYTPTKTASFENFVKLLAADAWPRPPMTGPVVMTIRVFKSTPKGFSTKKSNQAENGDIRPITRPDCDNYLKSCSDALNSVVYKDDSQIISVHVYKFYSASPRTEIEIEEIEDGRINV